MEASMNHNMSNLKGWRGDYVVSQGYLFHDRFRLKVTNKKMEISGSIAHLIILQNDKVLWNKVPTWSDIAGVAAKHVVLLAGPKSKRHGTKVKTKRLLPPPKSQLALSKTEIKPIVAKFLLHDRNHLGNKKMSDVSDY